MPRVCLNQSDEGLRKSSHMLTLPIDTHLVAGLTIAVAFSLALLMLPWIANARGLWLLSLIAAAFYYWREFVGFVIVGGIGFLAVIWLSKQAPQARRWRYACFAMLALVAVFTCGRLWHWDRLWYFPWTGPLALYSLGMWPVLRLITLFWEVGSGSGAAPLLSQYVLWICFPLTLGSPLLRWSQMPGVFLPKPAALKSALWWWEATAATAKMAVGLSLAPGQALLASHWHSHFGLNAVATFLTGPFGFYLTNAGYLHWMQLLGGLCGINVPESYNYPIGRENISAFWMNWNMTATFVFRDYLFYNRWGGLTYNIYFNTILLFTLVGLWHAANFYWILWGFLHGLLFVTYLLWRKFGKNWSHLPLRGTRVANLAARLLTYFSVCMCWYLPSKILQKLAAL